MIKVIIERHAKDITRILTLLREVRTEAMKQPGYISGETMANIEDRSAFIVIGSWDSLKDGKAWYASKPRVEIDKKIEPLLVEPPRLTICRYLSYLKAAQQERKAG